MSRQKVLKIHSDDNIIVALEALVPGEVVNVDGHDYTISEPIKVKHKFATRDFAINDELIQYGVKVGKTTQIIIAGSAITTGNTAHSSESFSQRQNAYQWEKPDVSNQANSTFDGIKRPDGQIGTANYWIVVPLVFCQNRNVEQMKIALQSALGYSNETHYIDLAKNLANHYKASHENNANNGNSNNKDGGNNAGDRSIDGVVISQPNPRIFPNVDGVKFLTHSLGCGGTREDALALCKLIAGYIYHPNVAGATVLSLGCQNAQLSLMKSEIKKLDPDAVTPVLWFEQQAYGKERVMLDAAIKETFKGLVQANTFKRSPVPFSALKIGVECGGSDGFSGLSANPLIGRVADKTVVLGGVSILAEFPELCGVEQSLLDRCTRLESQQRFSQLMKAYIAHAAAVGASFDMNPSPGNIRDGLITDAMKSAGAALKGGYAPVEDVLDYTELVTRNGLNLLCTPGGDVESTTALVASGANLILFSTGLGTPTGNPIVPVLKISSSTKLYNRMTDIIDFDAGPIISGDSTVDALAESLFELCIKTASGRYITKARGLGQDDFIPWKRGVSL
ncbi:MAG: UxaA family hydrolase [Ostreibacterium sp.]